MQYKTNKSVVLFFCGVRVQQGRQSTHEDFTLASAPAESRDFATCSAPACAAIIKGVQLEPIDRSSGVSLVDGDALEAAAAPLLCRLPL
jgi:hypothetical protein